MKRMLFNATHAEETRVAIVDGQKLVDIDIEVAGHESRKSNIYKGIITRIEPSLEACFIDYGDVKHGFLSFKEVGKQYFKEGVTPSAAKIQEALHVGQELLVQMEKEERGNKGAALTSFISLAGRYMVLMPNNPRGGGVSRRIDGEDRSELRALMDQLQVPAGMGVIARTAAIDRTLEELQWDLNYLLQLWKAIDGASQTAGAFLIYQESSLIIRAIRDYFSADIKQILIDNDDVYEQARQFVGYVMPDMAERVVRYTEDVPLFTRFQIEHQIETAHSRQVPLPSGGSIVIDHTEALVAIDVNSARSTRGGDIEETATRTNLEAAEEAARQLRLRDLGGLVVIDFIDMEDTKNQRAVEAKLKEGLRHDRARLQMGKISRFGLMELSRQRLRPSLAEGSHMACPRCNGVGSIRDVNSTALHILRLVQEEAMKDGTAALHVQVPVDVATFLLNEKRLDLAKLETKLNVSVILIPNRHIETPHYKLDRIKHDDYRLDNPKPTHTLVEVPEEQDLSQNQSQVKAGQIAKVTGVTPPDRAPIVVRTARNSEAALDNTAGKAMLWARVKAFFTGNSSQQAANDSASSKSSKTSSAHASGSTSLNPNTGQNPSNHSHSNSNGLMPNGRSSTTAATANGRTNKPKLNDDRKDRNDRNDRKDKADRTGRNRPERTEVRTEKTERPVREPREIKDAKEAKDANPATPRADKPPRPERTDRKDRGIRGDANMPVSAASSAVLPIPIATELVTVEPTVDLNTVDSNSNSNLTMGNSESNTERNHRNRNRRSSRGRNRDERDNTAHANTDNDTDTNTDTHVVNAHHDHRNVDTLVIDTPNATAIVASVDATAAYSDTLNTPTIAPMVFTPDLVVVTEPAPLPIPIVPVRLDEAPLQSLSKEVGLEWVNTDHDAFAAAQAKRLNQPKPTRVPRERPARVAVAEEPLQLMETQK